MELTPQGFRKYFPEFYHTPPEPTDPSDDTIDMWLEVATYYVDPIDYCCRMLRGKQLEFAIYLMAAHLYSLFKQRKDEGDNPGDAQGGFIQSASIGDVSVTKASLPAKDTWDWWLQSTPYGQQLQSLLQVASVGGLSVGGLPERQGFRKIGGLFL